MDVNDMRVVIMLLGLVLFLGIWIWAWSSRRRAAFDEAAHLPFLDDDTSLDAQGRALRRRPPVPEDAATPRATAGDAP